MTTYNIPTESDLEELKQDILSNLYGEASGVHPVSKGVPVKETRLIGLSGYARSGKNTVGQILEDGYGFRQESFAQALKNVAAEINPTISTGGGGASPLATMFSIYEDWDAVKDAVPAAREFLQRLGVACRGQIGPNVWVDALARRLRTHPSARYVITDVRFPNEANFITDMGGQVWRIERPGYGPVNDHSSETALDLYGFDRTIVNDGSLTELRRKILNIGPS